MASPPSEWSAFQSLLINAFNKIVREDFKDNVPEEFSTDPESTLKYLFLLKAKDSQSFTMLKVLTFFAWRTYQNQQALLNQFRPWADPEDRPYICLYLKEQEPYKDSKNPQLKQIAARLNKTTSQITQAWIDNTVLEFKREFNPATYTYVAGNLLMNYHYPAMGFNRNNIYCGDKTEAQELVRKFSQCIDVLYDPDSFTEKGRKPQRKKTINYKGKTFTSVYNKAGTYRLKPYQVELYPGSGLPTELIHFW
jgi:hypothetical protein